MSQTAVLVWLSATSVLPTFRADLDAFAHSRLLRLEAPRENAASYHTSAYAPDAVAQIESSLEEARNAAAALEPSRALEALERAQRVLREHPELPQSAWLMAEILEQSAEIESSAPEGADASNALRKRRAALEGPRAIPFSDRVLESEPELEAPRAVRVEGLEPGDELSWDGVHSEPPLRTVAGEHHVRVARDGRLLWAGWLELGVETASVRLPVPETVACSTDDIGRGYFAKGRAIAAPHARCESYVLARAREGGIEVALCERALCENVVIWEHRQEAVTATSRSKKPLWPYAVAASVGALAVTSLALWRAGVFEHSEPSSHEVWVFNGQKQMGTGF
jgi:hypothetical protein